MAVRDLSAIGRGVMSVSWFSVFRPLSCALWTVYFYFFLVFLLSSKLSWCASPILPFPTDCPDVLHLYLCIFNPYGAPCSLSDHLLICCSLVLCILFSRLLCQSKIFKFLCFLRFLSTELKNTWLFLELCAQVCLLPLLCVDSPSSNPHERQKSIKML